MGLGSEDTHDLFVITKANTDNPGNAALNGSYHLIVSNANISTGFSMAAGIAHYLGDAKVFYQLAQNKMGVPEMGMEESTVAVDAAGSLEFSGLPGLPGLDHEKLACWHPKNNDKLLPTQINLPSACLS